MKSQGYKMIGGNGCEGGVDLGPIETDCPSEQSVGVVKGVKVVEQLYEYDSNNNLFNQMRNNKELVLFMVVLIVLAIMKDKVLGIIKIIMSARKVNKNCTIYN